MIKEFDRWNTVKKVIDQKSQSVNFHEREIWWCVIGVNVGSEQHSQTSNFSRPVIIFKKLAGGMFLGIPTTTKIRAGKFRVRFSINGVENDMLIGQARSFDRKRLVRKIGTLPEDNFQIPASQMSILFPEKTKTPDGVFSEAEAEVWCLTDSSHPESSEAEAIVCKLSVADQICLSNEVDYLLSRGEI